MITSEPIRIPQIEWAVSYSYYSDTPGAFRSMGNHNTLKWDIYQNPFYPHTSNVSFFIHATNFVDHKQHILMIRTDLIKLSLFSIYPLDSPLEIGGDYV